MSAKFDRDAAGNGVQAEYRFGAERVIIRWSFFLIDPEGEGTVRLTVRDREGKTVLECISGQWEEEPAQSLLLHPRLWSGVSDPYLYTLEALLLDRNGCCSDRICRSLALYRLEYRGDAGLFLNGNPFQERGVRYCLPAASAEGQRRMLQDLQRMLELGVNTVYVEQGEGLLASFLRMCEKMGFLPGKGGESAPMFCGGRDCLIHRETGPTTLFYRYKAEWSREPFVYIAPESVKSCGDGTYTASVYSNCSRVVLYSDGVLHEFRSGSGEFVFRGIPGKRPCLVLTAEGDGCTESLSVHRAFVKQNIQ